MKTTTLGGQIYVRARTRVFAHRKSDPFFSHGVVFEGPSLVSIASGRYAIALYWVLKNGVGYIYLLGTYDTFPEAEAAYAAFGAYAQNPFPLNHYGEYYNAYLRYPVLGKFTGDEWYQYTLTH